MARSMVKAAVAAYLAVASYGYLTVVLVPAYEEAGLAGLALHACIDTVLAAVYVLMPEQE